MFTLFRPELEAFARTALTEHQQLHKGGWSTGDLHALQMERAAETIRYVRANSAFYRDRLRDVALAPSGPISPQELAAVPFTTKDDLRAELFDVMSQPLDKAWVFYETTGTTGRATPCPRDEHDSIVNNTALTLAYEDIFAQHGERHVVAVMGPTELHSTGDTFGDVLRNLGHTVVKMWPHSPVVGFPRALALLEKLGVTALVCTPGMAISLAKAAREAGIDLHSRLGVRLILTLGELTSPAMLENLGALWSASVYNCMYASQEASIMAACHADGRLHTVPLNNYFEVVDPDTGQAVEAVSGVREGELVVTHLYQGAKPLVRYRTGDMVRLSAQADSVHEVLQPIGRVRDALHLGGRRVTAYDLEQTLFTHIRGVIDYFLLIDEVDGQDLVTVNLEPTDAAAGLRLDRELIRRAVADAFGVRCEVVLGSMDAITSTGAMVSWKAARIHDRRGSEPEPERLAALAIATGRDAR
ncbi:phenylacetate--CoA ligase family protein [Streptomyces sp. B1I3]|uniref:phenylacetate--CoA ligase family protein n=1 Tax=Streptomyces sp. B1I3 TaxID=3042264 RepID=UPI00278B053A|nr:AMP-binding protein [Streptomyces sp. B1I3]MDQ0794223.1 phenylacetate-CoA ligase [Streptomyces sp. B1I3]